MTSRVRVVARLAARPDKVEALRAALLAVIEPTRREVGCLSYELLQNLADPTDFTFVEEWDSNAALDAHLQTAHLATLRQAVADVLVAAPDIRRYTTLR
ncbi:MAG: putative quinol monooxygenase [Panacagrimonas sp.]